jgi:hypothetical protein
MQTEANINAERKLEVSSFTILSENVPLKQNKTRFEYTALRV